MRTTLNLPHRSDSRPDDTRYSSFLFKLTACALIAVVAFYFAVESVGCVPAPAILTAPSSGSALCHWDEVECVTQHSCCPENNTCGGEAASVGCPAGECCYLGSPAEDLLSSRVPSEQRKVNP